MSLGFVKEGKCDSRGLSDRSLLYPFPIYGKLKACVEATWIQSTPVPPLSPPLPTSSKKLENFYYKKFTGVILEPSLLRSRFYCVTAAMDTKWGKQNDKGDKIAFGKVQAQEKEQQVEASFGLK